MAKNDGYKFGFVPTKEKLKNAKKFLKDKSANGKRFEAKEKAKEKGKHDDLQIDYERLGDGFATS